MNESFKNLFKQVYGDMHCISEEFIAEEDEEVLGIEVGMRISPPDGWSLEDLQKAINDHRATIARNEDGEYFYRIKEYNDQDHNPKNLRPS